MSYKNFHFDLDDAGVATVLIDRQGTSVNTLGQELMEEFEDIVERLERDDVRAVVIGTAKKDFLAGADINIFDELSTPEEAAGAMRIGHAMNDRIEALHKERGTPVVAAIDGACLGGGLEIAMAASMRICTDNPRTKLGQPEVQLGVIPGAGATQRLPELIGIAPALEIIVSGKPVMARKAKKLGLVDEVVPQEVLLDIARKRAIESIDPEPAERVIALNVSSRNLQRLALETTPAGRKVLFKKATDAMVKATGGHYPAPRKAIEAIRIGVEDGREAGVAAEIGFFSELLFTPESKALRSVFFASTQLKSDSGVESDVTARPVESIGVIGGGLMGAGIATVSTITAETPVRLKEVDNEGVGRGLAHITKEVKRRAKRRRLSPFEVDRLLHRVTGTAEWNGFGNVDLVIEAVFEDLDLKQSILREVEAQTSDKTIFASNTSSLPISSIAEASNRPETVVGMHYFSPVEKMPLLEVIRTEQTADWVTATAVEFGKRQGKTVIVVNDGTGFYTSRIIGPYSNEAAFLLYEGASVEAIDGAMTGWGFPVGPLLLADEVGLDVGAHISVIFHDAFGDRFEGPPVMQTLVDDGRKGRKNGRGFYQYTKGQRGDVDPTVYQALGLPAERQPVRRSHIQERLSLAFINEAARCLEEGILRSARDGDIGAVFGIGYPPFRGGPFFTVDTMGAGHVVDRLEALAADHGDRFAPADILVTHAKTGKNFRSQ